MGPATVGRAAITMFLLTLGPLAAQAVTPQDVDDLVGMPASRGETKLGSRGYHYSRTIKVSNSSISYWFHPRKQVCIAVTTTDGRYKAIAEQPKAACEPGGSGEQHGHETTVTCESKDGKYRYCREHVGSRHVQLTRRLSSSRCNRGESWGYDRDGIWVNKGCRAVFEIH
jgi:hypothetical protein